MNEKEEEFTVYQASSAWLHYILLPFWPAIYMQACVLLHMKQLLEADFATFLLLCANF